MAESKSDQRVAAVRRFNRFYTRRIGLLHEGYLASAFSLTEGRVLYELAHQDTVDRGHAGRELGLDPGYLSRIVRGFEKRGLLERTRSKADGRQSLLTLTRRGHDAFAPLHTRSRDEIGAMLAPCRRPTRIGWSRPCTRSSACSARGRSRRPRTC